MMQKLFTIKENYNESENPLISTARSISDRVAGFFAENETAMVIKKFREIDPNFQMEPFLREMRDYMLPEVLDAYVKGDVETLKLWLSDAQFHVYAALAKQYTTAGLKSDGRILDIRVWIFLMPVFWTPVTFLCLLSLAGHRRFTSTARSRLVS